MNKAISVAAVLATLSLLAPADLQAQSRWQVTASLVTGGFSGDLATEPFTADLRFEGVGGIDPNDRFPVRFNRTDVEEEDLQGYSFDSFVGFGATAEWRRQRLGVFGSLTWVPTRAVSVTRDDIPSGAARAFGFEGTGEETEVQLRLKTAQNLLIPMAGITYYSEDLPRPGRPPAPYEFYFTGGVGIVNYMDSEPILQDSAGEDWDTPVMFNVGGGLFVNFTSSIGLRVDARGSFWKTEVNQESKTQTMISFSPGFVFIL